MSRTAVAAPADPFEELFAFIDQLPVKEVAAVADKLRDMSSRGTYTCADCGNAYPKGWTDEEAAAERDRDFPGLDDEDAAVVCDDCYQAMRKRADAMRHPWSWT